ncbi:MAG: O-antigen ligase family protein [Coriobacteriia bacterium]|nr:O-antigen ligase family protein [Coriobacteriia bacterium]
MSARFSVQHLAWYCFCLIFPASALINGIIPLRGANGLYAFGGMLSIRAAAFLLPLACAGILWAYATLRGQLQLRPNPLHWVLLALAGLIVVATLCAQDQTVALFGSRTNGQGALLWISYLLCAFLASQLIVSRERMRQILWVIVGTATVVAALALGEVAGIIDNGLPQFDWMLDRGIATMYTSDHLGTFLVVPTIMAAGLALTTKGRELYLSAACTAVLLYSLVFTMTRGAWIAAFVGLVVLSVLLLLSQRQNIRSNWQRIALLWTAVVLVVLSFLTLFSGSEFTQRFEHAVSDFQVEGQALAGRAALWTISLDVIGTSPLVGVGADNIIYAAVQSPEMQALEREGGGSALGSPHNVYLEFALNFGLVFALLMLALVVVLCLKTLRIILRNTGHAKQGENKDTIIWLAALVGLSTAFIVAITNVAIMAVFFCLLGFLLKGYAQQLPCTPTKKGLYATIAALLIVLLSTGLAVYGSLEAVSALRGNMHLRSDSATRRHSLAALQTAPWRKEPLLALFQSSVAMAQRGELSHEDLYDTLYLVIEKDPLTPEPYLVLAQMIFFSENDHERARDYAQQALRLRPTSANAQEFLAEVEAAIETAERTDSE